MASKFILKELSRYRIGTYADIIYRNALLYPEEEAFIYGEERVTFQEFNARVNSLIHALNALDIRPVAPVIPEAASFVIWGLLILSCAGAGWWRRRKNVADR